MPHRKLRAPRSRSPRPSHHLVNRPAFVRSERPARTPFGLLQPQDTQGEGPLQPGNARKRGLADASRAQDGGSGQRERRWPDVPPVLARRSELDGPPVEQRGAQRMRALPLDPDQPAAGAREPPPAQLLDGQAPRWQGHDELLGITEAFDGTSRGKTDGRARPRLLAAPLDRSSAVL